MSTIIAGNFYLEFQAGWAIKSGFLPRSHEGTKVRQGIHLSAFGSVDLNLQKIADPLEIEAFESLGNLRNRCEPKEKIDGLRV